MSKDFGDGGKRGRKATGSGNSGWTIKKPIILFSRVAAAAGAAGAAILAARAFRKSSRRKDGDE
jgi:hypothetical protein